MFESYFMTLGNCLNFKGRATSREYSYFAIVNVFLLLSLSIIDKYIPAGFVESIYIILSVCFISLTIRRCRDVGLGWFVMLLTILTPLGFFVFFYLLFARSKD